MDKLNEEIYQSLHVLRVLARAYNSVTEHSYRSSKSFGLKPNEFAILELLYHKGPQQPKEISDQLLLVGGGVTYVLNKLEDNGLIERTMSKSDRRKFIASLTEKGLNLMEEIFPVHAENIHRALSGLNTEEKDKIIVLLKKLGMTARDLLEKHS